MDLDKVKLEILEKFSTSATLGDNTNVLLGKVCSSLGLDPSYAEILFPAGPSDILTLLLEVNFNNFIANLDHDQLLTLRTKDRVKFLLMGLLKELKKSKIALRVICRSSVNIGLLITKIKASWRIVDDIWYLAGDRAVDFNFYTKRALLFSVFVPSFVYWFKQNDEAAVERLIDGLLMRVSRIGKIKAKIKEKINLGKIFPGFADN
jgi:ubiquinone biosynthesis protein COQ9